MKNENESSSEETSRGMKLNAETERLHHRIKELQLQLDFLNECYSYSKITLNIDFSQLPVKIKFARIKSKKWSIMCFQN